MKLKIKSIHSAGDLSKERLVLEATEDLDVGSHVIFAARRGSAPHRTLQGGLVPFCYWLPDKKVAKGDLVVVYTKSGSTSSKQNESNTSYFFYWDLKAPVWVEDRYVVILEIGNWTGREFSEIEQAS